ncbi:MAG: hypothetical protein KatS3mg083_279 [Candidatus Dojkabacteria bacterium]|nr:MAG: hypothetical protein KatS3mg083_279 [Candidatus Dojkabacteria bacterium]
MRLDYAHVILSIIIVFLSVRYCQKSRALNDCLDRNTDPGMVIVYKYDTVYIEKRDTLRVPRGDTIKILRYDSVYIRDRDTFYVNPIFIFKDTTRNIDLEVIGGKDTFSYHLIYSHSFSYNENSNFFYRRYSFYNECATSVDIYRFRSGRIFPSIYIGAGLSYSTLGTNKNRLLPTIQIGIGLSYDLRRKSLKFKR